MTDDEFIEQFEGRTLPFDQWTHRAHVRVAFIYCRRHGLDGAIERLRNGIQAYNAANEVPEGPLQGYNETTTQAFLRLVASTMAAYGDRLPTPNADSFCDTHPHLLHRSVLRLFYSRLDQQPAEAKTRFVEPDLTPLRRPRL